MKPTITIKMDSFIAGISVVGKKVRPIAKKAATIAAHGVNAKAMRRCPTRFGELINSAKVESNQSSSGSVVFGFNKEYADVVDRGWKTPIIRPKKAKVLFIPITRRGARRGALSSDLRALRAASDAAKKAERRRSRKENAKPVKKSTKASSGVAKQKSKGVRSSGRKKKATRDFIFARFVRTRRAVKGSTKGPNFYFSGTLDDVVANGTLERFLVDAIREQIPEL